MTLKWGYKEAFQRCALLFVVGAALQILLGDFENRFLRQPWGLIFAINYLYLLVVVYVQSDKWRWMRQLYDSHAMISSLTSMVVLTIIFGLTRQDPDTEGIVGMLGFSRMTSSWIFNILLFYFMTALGVNVVQDLHRWRQRRLAAIISHVAIFTILCVGCFGSAGKERVTVSTSLDKATHIGRDKAGNSMQLPFAITLKEFKMEEYPAKLYILDTKQESSSEEYLLVEQEGLIQEIDGWRLEVVKSLDMAGAIPGQSNFREMKHVGAAPAVYVKAENLSSKAKYEGWVSCGSHIFEPAYLRLGEQYAVAMPRREAKKYLSRIVVQDSEGESHRFEIEVNKPATLGSWKIYQVGYDNARGRWSTHSVLECVRDGWYPVTHIALWLTIAAGVVMFLTAGGRKVSKSNIGNAKSATATANDKIAPKRRKEAKR